MTKTIAGDVLERLKSAVGADAWSQDPGRLDPKLHEWRDRWTGETPLLLSPRTVEAVSAALRLCFETRTPVTLQGGNTGLVGGQIPAGEVLLSLEGLRRIRALDLLDDVIIAEAGVTLRELRDAATGAGRLFPVSLASEGSCTVGGLVSTNAGGVAALRHGVMRAQVLGLEVVCADGRIHQGLKRLRKNTAGYDLNQLFIGSEGTLGVVTAACLRLQPQPGGLAVGMVGVRSPAEAVSLLRRVKERFGGAPEAFELMSRQGVALAVKRLSGVREPLAEPAPWTVLVEIAGASVEAARDALEAALEDAFKAGGITDAALAQNETQAQAFWALREGQSAAQKGVGPAWKHDVAVPVSRVADFIERADRLVEALEPGAFRVAFGHIGDGNIHYDVLTPAGGDERRHAGLREEAARQVHDLAVELGGTLSAEHGVGVMKSAEALRLLDPVDVQLMRSLRAALDPRGILNPRVLF